MKEFLTKKYRTRIGVNLKQTPDDNRSKQKVFFKAVNTNQIKIVKNLIPKGLDVNVKNSIGKTPLFYAVINDNILLIKFLIFQGAMITIRDDFNRSILFYVKRRLLTNPLWETISLQFNANEKDLLGYYPIAYAIQINNRALFVYLMKQTNNFIDKDKLKDCLIQAEQSPNHFYLQYLKTQVKYF